MSGDLCTFCRWIHQIQQATPSGCRPTQRHKIRVCWHGKSAFWLTLLGNGRDCVEDVDGVDEAIVTDAALYKSRPTVNSRVAAPIHFHLARYKAAHSSSLSEQNSVEGRYMPVHEVGHTPFKKFAAVL